MDEWPLVHKLNINKAIKKNDWSIAPVCGGSTIEPPSSVTLTLQLHYTTQPSSSVVIILNLQGLRTCF